MILHLFRVVEKRILCSPSRYGLRAALHAALQPFLGGAKHSSHQAPEQRLEYFHVQYAAVLCVVYQAQAKDNNKPSSLTNTSVTLITLLVVVGIDGPVEEPQADGTSRINNAYKGGIILVGSSHLHSYTRVDHTCTFSRGLRVLFPGMRG